MYNRYIPQSDGTYRRKSIPDMVSNKVSVQNSHPLPAQIASDLSQQEDRNKPKNVHINQYQRPRHQRKQNSKESQQVSAYSFLRNLLPKDLDTEDLLVVILLLLMSGDCGDDSGNALLTLALYLFS